MNTPELWRMTDLCALLAQTVGDEMAHTVIKQAARDIGLNLRRGIPSGEVLTLLDHIAQTPGLVGITARFAKSRVLLG